MGVITFISCQKDTENIEKIVSSAKEHESISASSRQELENVDFKSPCLSKEKFISLLETLGKSYYDELLALAELEIIHLNFKDKEQSISAKQLLMYALNEDKGKIIPQSFDTERLNKSIKKLLVANEKASAKYTSIAQKIYRSVNGEKDFSASCWSCFWKCWWDRDLMGDGETFTGGCYDKHILNKAS